MLKTLALTPTSPAERLRSIAEALFLLYVRRSVARAVNRGKWPAFNGQVRRRDTVERLVAHYQPDVIVETGTFLGSSTRLLASMGVPVLSVEASPRHFYVAVLRLLRCDEVTLAMGDSVTFLSYLAAPSLPRYERPFFYLDAHWGGHLPLREELELVWAKWAEAIVVIDDFMIPDDSQFGYDDYGGGDRIDLEYCRPPEDVDAYLPGQPAQEETGGRRGTGYFAQGATARAALDRASREGLIRPAVRIASKG